MLGLTHDCTNEQIEEAYQGKKSQYSPGSAELYKLEEARKTLLDPQRRKSHDFYLNESMGSKFAYFTNTNVQNNLTDAELKAAEYKRDGFSNWHTSKLVLLKMLRELIQLQRLDTNPSKLDELFFDLDKATDSARKDYFDSTKNRLTYARARAKRLEPKLESVIEIINTLGIKPGK